MKKLWIVLFFFFCLCTIKYVHAEERLGYEVAPIQIIFATKTVTTRTISSFLPQEGVIQEMICKKNFPYLDENMEQALNQIYSRSFESYEMLVQKQLESYGFFDESEKIKREGVLLDSITVYLPKREVAKLLKTDGIKVNVL